jgi:hypothetical protein
MGEEFVLVGQQTVEAAIERVVLREAFVHVEQIWPASPKASARGNAAPWASASRATEHFGALKAACTSVSHRMT